LSEKNLSGERREERREKGDRREGGREKERA